MNRYLVAVTYRLNQNIPAPIPSGFVWRGQKQFYMKSSEQPTMKEIRKEALRHGASTDGFGVIAITKVEKGFRNFDEPAKTSDDNPDS